MTDLLAAADEADALELLHREGLTDGLPVIIPTPERVSRMVLASGFEADLSFGAMGPAGGVATVEKVAVAAVMAGCLPDYMPVVVAAVRAVMQPAFDLSEMQATTHCTAPLLIVNGPARFACGPIASGFGALGPGHRANASIGRALRLAMINIGGGRTGVSDMALLGHPGKFTYCLAEDEENSPFEPLHVARGFAADDSVVTVIGAEGPHSVVHVPNGDDPKDHERLLEVLAIGLANLASNNGALGQGGGTVVLNPDHARVLARAGLDRRAVMDRLADVAVTPWSEIRRVAPAFVPPGEPTGVRRAFRDPADILVLTAGGAGLYSMVMPSWCVGPHRNSAVSQLVELGQACEIPGWSRSAGGSAAAT